MGVSVERARRERQGRAQFCEGSVCASRVCLTALLDEYSRKSFVSSKGLVMMGVREG